MEPTIRVRQRSAVVHAAALESNYTPLQANLLAGRLADHQAINLHSHVRPQMADLDSPDTLPDIDKAVERICRAIKGREDVILCVDHDADGVTSIVSLRGALIDIFGHPAERTHNFISHRMKEGYGISDGVVDRIAKAGHRSGVLISGDQGSGDQPRVKRLLDMGIDTVVTDTMA